MELIAKFKRDITFFEPPCNVWSGTMCR